jgi:hypothetical protein
LSDDFAKRLAQAPESVWLREVCLLAPGERLPDAPAVLGHRLGRLARGHGLAPRAGSRVAAAEATPDAAAGLVTDWRHSLGEQALVDEALGRIGAAAEREGLPLMVLKGGDLRRRLYGPGERPSNDLDLLVAPHRRDEAFQLLEELGYRSSHPRDEHQREHWFATTLRHGRRERLQVDLHWGLAAPGRARWDIEEVLLRGAVLEGVPGCLVMAETDLAVYLALHAVAFHGAIGRWVWWLDLRLLSEASSTVGRGVGEHAASLGGRVAWEAATLRVEQLFGGRQGVPAAGPRARVIAALAARGELGGERLRRLIAALAVDAPTDLARAVTAAAKRELSARRPARG